MTEQRKKELLLHFLVNFAIKRFFKRKLTDSEIKNLFNIFVAEKLLITANRLSISVKTIKMHRRSIHDALKPEYKRAERKLTEEILHNSLFESCIDLISDQTFREIEALLIGNKNENSIFSEDELPNDLPLGSNTV